MNCFTTSSRKVKKEKQVSLKQTQFLLCINILDKCTKSNSEQTTQSPQTFERQSYQFLTLYNYCYIHTESNYKTVPNRMYFRWDINTTTTTTTTQRDSTFLYISWLPGEMERGWLAEPYGMGLDTVRDLTMPAPSCCFAISLKCL